MVETSDPSVRACRWHRQQGQSGGPIAEATLYTERASSRKKLKRLYLGSTQTTDAGCATLVAALDSGALPALQTLDLHSISASAAAKAVVHEALARSRVAARAPVST